MRLDRLALRGLFLFDDEVVLPAAELPRGLIAIVGPNGEGKTALIESAVAVLHREYPSKPNEVHHYATTREAFIEADYHLDDEGGGDARVRLNIDAVSKKYEGVVLRRQYPHEPWVAQSDGKMVTYDAAVRGIFPSLTVLLATAFASQNRRGSFSDLSQAERKDLFAELLGLGQYERWAAGCAEVVRAIARRREILLPWVMRLRTDTMADRAAGVAAMKAGAVHELAQAAEALEAAEAARHSAEFDVDMYRSRATSAAARQLERGQIAARLETGRLERARVDVDAAAVTERLRARLVSIDERLEADDATLDRRLATLFTDEQIDRARQSEIEAIRAECDRDDSGIRARIRNNEELLATADAVRAAAAMLDALERVVEAAAGVVVEDETRYAERDRELDAARGTYTQESGWPDRLAAAETAAGLIDRVPFGAKCAEAGCEFVAAAVTARASLEDCRAGTARFDEASAVLAGCEFRRRAVRETLETHRADLATARQALAKLDGARMRDRVVKLNHAEARVQELQAELTDRHARGDRDSSAVDNRAASHKEQTANGRASVARERDALRARAAQDGETADIERARALEVLDGRRQAADAAIAAAEARGAELAATAAADMAAVEDLATAEATLRTAAAAERDASTRRGAAGVANETANRTVDAFDRAVAECQTAEAALAELAALDVQWGFFATAFGRDGLPNLEIDAAGPIITELANDLMLTCFGEQRFTIEIVTQQARQKGGLKESFEMQVYDARRAGKPRDLGDLSGGQRVLVDEAVKCALMLYMNDHSRAAIGTCFRDETTSMLYPDFIPRYVDMLRRVQARGRFGQLFFCTHSPIAASMADAQLVVVNGTVTVKLPPYDDAPLTAWGVAS